MRHLDLFAGIGGFSKAVEWLGGTTVGFVEWDAWNRRVLAKLREEFPFDVVLGMHPVVATTAEGDAVINVESFVGMLRPESGVVCSQLASGSGGDSAPLAGVAITLKDTAPPYRNLCVVRLSGALIGRDAALPKRIVLTSHPAAATGVRTLLTTHELISARLRTESLKPLSWFRSAGRHVERLTTVLTRQRDTACLANRVALQHVLSPDGQQFFTNHRSILP